MPNSEARAPMVSVHGLSHRYTRDWAVSNVNFELDGAGIVGLLGSNGAGKSTCMNILCGVLFPTEGDVLIDGHSIRQAPLAAKARIGFLPQQAPLYPEMTVDEYLSYCAELRGIEYAAIRPAVEAAKERCGIAHFSERLIGALSGGYRQRVGLAQAILHNPSLVVLDEPTNGLDPNQILVVRELIKEIAKERTVLLSTHILSEVEVLCDAIKMIERGRIVFEGSLEAFAGVVEPNSLIAVFDRPPPVERLTALPGVEQAAFMTRTKARLQFTAGARVADAMTGVAVAEDWALQELYYERSTLEDVFARLSSGQKEDPIS